MNAEEELQALRKLMESELERRRDRNRKILVVVVFAGILCAVGLPTYFAARNQERKEKEEKAREAEELIRQRQERIKTRQMTEELLRRR